MENNKEYAIWLEQFKNEKIRIAKNLKTQNKYLDNDKIEYLAKKNVGPPPDSGWKK